VTESFLSSSTLELLGARGLFAFVATVATVGCATPYAYQFRISDPGAHSATAPGDRDSIEDDRIKAEFQMSDGAILLGLTNKTEQNLQVEWDKVVLDRGDGTRTSVRPERDLGWVSPGTKASVRLVPFTCPRSGKAALAYEGRRLELAIPMVVRSETVVYRVHFLTHVEPQ
jgi:hypothetical protein